MRTTDVLLALLVARPASADVWTYPIKSTNLAAAPSVSWYNGFATSDLLKLSDGSPGIGEGHAVGGTSLSDGGFVVCGQGGKAAPENEMLYSFALKVDANGIFEWAWVGQPAACTDLACARVTGRSRLANSVAQLPDGDILVAGVTTDADNGAFRSLTKLSLKAPSGTTYPTVIWDTHDFGDGQHSAEGHSGAWEMILTISDGVMLTGLHNWRCQPECSAGLGFKSGGNVDEGEAVLLKLPFSAVNQNTYRAPPGGEYPIGPFSVEGSPGFQIAPTGTTVKTARQVPGMGNSGGLVLVVPNSLADPPYTTLMKVNNEQGAEVWSTRIDASIGEVSCMDIAADGTIALGGLSQDLGRWGVVAVTVGRLTGFNSNGVQKWTNTYTEGGEPELIRRECWGTVAMPDNAGFALICGTGIEPGTCAALSNSATVPAGVANNCTNGIGDYRPGAIARDPNVLPSPLALAHSRQP